jgi:predicted ATPase with chaperone activity
MDRFGLSARAHARILKIARTIADLEAEVSLYLTFESSHVAEAIQ